MRDLEIRGAGNLLGPEQSGYMMSVGYDMYLQLLEEAVLEQRGEKAPQRTECSADLTVSANLPESYIPSGEQRMDIYRRIAALRTAEQSQGAARRAHRPLRRAAPAGPQAHGRRAFCARRPCRSV
ncbi:MAG: TRCF domain-containing protein [Oscillibacter sp.]